MVKYVAAKKSKVNLSDHYGRHLIAVLFKFSKSNNNEHFKDIIRRIIRPRPSFFTKLILGKPGYKTYFVRGRLEYEKGRPDRVDSRLKWYTRVSACAMLKVIRHGSDRNTTFTK
jgi:hypothetical protein